MGLSLSMYPQWKAPAEDGQTLIWPAAGEIVADTLANQKALSTGPLAELRREMRRSIGHDDARPLIVHGHQAELYHPGVWVKSVLAAAAAVKLNGIALHIAVDTDAPKHLTLRWTGGSEPITDDPSAHTAHWCGFVAAPSAEHAARLKHKLAGHPSVIRQFLELMPGGVDLASAIMQASHALDMQLGVKDQVTLASPLWLSRPFLAFVHQIVARAREFAQAYNSALAIYRREQKVRTPTRPMPDLAVFEESVELPLWLDELETGGRSRPSVFVSESGYVISLANGDEFTFGRNHDAFDAADRLADWLNRNQVRFSPRALVLTMFVRLCMADQFVHGIGGGRYDQVTDLLIADFFRITPPKFCVTTATMYLPEAAGRTRTCVACIEGEGHKLRHSILGAAKRSYLLRIAAAPRQSPQRYEAFAQMHRELATAVRSSPAVQRWERELQEAQEREAAEAVTFDRELFYALQPRHRLEQMLEKYRV